MARYNDNAPIGHTCPMIDSVLDAIKTLYRSSEEMSKGEFDYFKKVLEDIRTANGTLRDWGNQECKDKEGLENECDELTKEVEELKREVSDLEDKLGELEKYYNELKFD